MKAKLLKSAEFIFDDCTLEFAGNQIILYSADGDRVGLMFNDWVSKGVEEVEGVMGRKFKPRDTDAKHALRLIVSREDAAKARIKKAQAKKRPKRGTRTTKGSRAR